MKTQMKRIVRQFIAAAVLLGVSATAFSASIGLTPVFPDQTTSGANIVYVYEEPLCENLLGGGNPAGPCGTSGGGGPNAYDYSGDEVGGGGTLTITEGAMAFNIGDGNGLHPVSSGDYELIANFDANGNIVDASLSVFGTIDQSFGGDPGSDFQSGTIGLSTSLLDFGFSGDGTTGSFEFIFDSATGDLPDFVNGDQIFVIASGVSTFAALSSFSNGSNGWDPLNNDDTSIFQQSFSGTGQVNTFVPVPAAAWLFMSALMGMGFVKRRNA